ncbi:hypothetical protein AVEN_48150-1 [Araneus ventricosus]|uniref:Uncharacterized protein n=1 Tax=Araneus ventricosus TaxID=182803 RepID=A0A4Y2FAI9_ARAVE|nr:hypothetical protein AVEN_48150-1 [Araneus ventricosus]
MGTVRTKFSSHDASLKALKKEMAALKIYNLRSCNFFPRVMNGRGRVGGESGQPHFWGVPPSERVVCARAGRARQVKFNGQPSFLLSLAHFDEGDNRSILHLDLCNYLLGKL